MFSSFRRRLFPILTCSVLSAASDATQFDDQVQVLLGPGSSYGLNEGGTVVGITGSTAARSLPATKDYTPRTWNALTAVGGSFSEAWSVNSAGTVCGNVQDSGPRAFVLNTDGTVRRLASISSWSYDINDAGDIIGRVLSGSQSWMRVWLGSVTPLDPNGQTDISGGWGLNDSGYYAGYQTTGTISKGMRFDPSKKLLGSVAGYNNHLARKINPLGDAVGRAFQSGKPNVAVFWSHTDSFTAVVLTPLGGNSAVQAAEAYDINDRGDEIVGWSQDSGGNSRATIWKKMSGQFLPFDLNLLDTDKVAGQDVMIGAYRIHRNMTIAAATATDAVLVNRVPLYKQGDQRWGGQRYLSDENTRKMSGVGCNLTSIAMTLRALGVDTGADGKPVTPGNLNSWLKANQRFECTVDLLTWTFSYDFYPADIEAYTGGAVSLLSNKNGHDTDRALIEGAIDAGNPVVLRVQGSLGAGAHSVVATGYAGATGSHVFLIRDPASSQNRSSTRLDDAYYHNDWEGFRKWGLVNGPSRQSSRLEAAVHFGGAIMITDPFGRRCGYDPGTGITYNEIPGAAYLVEPGLEDQDSGGTTGGYVLIDAPSVATGSFMVKLSALSEVPYDLHLITTDSGGGRFEQHSVGQLGAGQSRQLVLALDSSDSGSSAILTVGSLVASGVARDGQKSVAVTCSASCDGTTVAGSFSAVGPKLNVVSTALTSADFTGASSTISGKCTVDGLAGGTFCLTVIPAGTAKRYHLTVRDAQGQTAFEKVGTLLPLLGIGPHG